MKVASRTAVTELRCFDSVKSASRDHQNVRGIPNYQIMFNVSYIGLWPSYHKIREIAIEKFITHKFWRKHMACLEGSTGGDPGRVQAERSTGCGALAFIRVCE